MANIRKRGSKYQVQVRRKGFSPAIRSFHTKQDAQEWLRYMETKADRGDLPISTKELSNHRLLVEIQKLIYSRHS
jgi:hypothetical protein